MTIEDKIKEAMARMIERRTSFEGVEVNSWEEEFEKGSFEGCWSCGYGADDDSYYVTIYYTHSGIKQSTYYRYEDSFGQLIKELDSDD